MAEMVSPSVSSSITARLEVQARPTAVSELTTAIEKAGGIVTALDVTASGHEQMTVDVTCATRGEQHAADIVEALKGLHGVVVERVSDRTFLMHLGGKLSIESKVPLRNRDDLSMAYTPGVARVCEAIAAHPEDARRLTIKRNTIAVVTDGTAVLGLGNIGPLASLPVMEGKAVLFKRFAGIDAFPIALDTTDVDQIVETICAIAPVFAGINLEDISAPRCFEIERRLRERLDIPVFHDDQHGTAIVVVAALTNALKVVSKDLATVRIVLSGAGAAGTAVLKLLLAAGAEGRGRRGHRGRHPRGPAGARRVAVLDGEHDQPARHHGLDPRRAPGRRRVHRRLRPGRDHGPRRLDDGEGRDRVRPGQPAARGRPGRRGAVRGGRRHGALGLRQPDQQRARVPRRVPRAAGRAVAPDHRARCCWPRRTRWRRWSRTTSSTRRTSCPACSTRRSRRWSPPR